jgi:hypothetical protein
LVPIRHAVTVLQRLQIASQIVAVFIPRGWYVWTSLSSVGLSFHIELVPPFAR